MAKSGKYQRTFSYGTWEVRLDVDGNYPQNRVSVTLSGDYTADYMFDMTASAEADTWTGDILYKGDDTLTIDGKKPRKIKIFHGVDAIGTYINFYLYDSADVKLIEFYLDRTSDYFRSVEFEFDYEEGIDADAAQRVTVGGTTHTLQSVYQAAGIQVTVNGSGNQVASAGSGVDERWNSAELQDAMQTHWSKDNGTPWALWVFFCKRHVSGYLGVMFDSSDAHQRNGTAIFVTPHAGWAREDEDLFFTTAHEVGHAFNLAHSWRKTADPWMAGIVNEADALSFMNYPDKYAQAVHGSSDMNLFYDSFEYRFSDQELQFMRHAPNRLVQMGNEAFESDHGRLILGENARSTGGRSSSPLRLEARLAGGQALLEFMEPVYVDLSLKNVSDKPVSVKSSILDDLTRVAIWVRRNDLDAKYYAPYTRPCIKEENVVLQPGEELANSTFLSAGRDGWLIAEPGKYSVSMALALDDGSTISSNDLTFGVLAPPREAKDENEKLAADYFSDGVGRVLAFNGSMTLTKANETLMELTERMGDREAVKHAKLALALPGIRNYKLVEADSQGVIKARAQNPDSQAMDAVKELLGGKGTGNIRTMGNVAMRETLKNAAEDLKTQGDDKGAKTLADNALKALEEKSLPTKLKKEIEDTIKETKK